MTIKANLERIRKELPEEVTLVAVSKTEPVSDLMEAYSAGQRIFGENKIQEMAEKQKQMPADVEWHMIGHVQTNKVKQMADFVDLIHGVDSLKLLQEIDRQAKKHERTINCLLQMHIAEEETKFGMDKQELKDLLRSPEFSAMQNIKVKGLMGMATFTDNQQQIENEFTQLKTIYDELGPRYGFRILSMGMSGDFPIAVRCGSNMVRIGSSIFGHR